jgi:hypothetical protein
MTQVVLEARAIGSDADQLRRHTLAERATASEN